MQHDDGGGAMLGAELGKDVFGANADAENPRDFHIGFSFAQPAADFPLPARKAAGGELLRARAAAMFGKDEQPFVRVAGGEQADGEESVRPELNPRFRCLISSS